MAYNTERCKDAERDAEPLQRCAAARWVRCNCSSLLVTSRLFPVEHGAVQMLQRRASAGVENPGNKSGHFYKSGPPITTQVATADGWPLVASYDSLLGELAILPQIKHGRNFMFV